MLPVPAACSNFPGLMALHSTHLIAVLAYVVGTVCGSMTVIQDGWPNGPLVAAVIADQTLVFSGNTTVPDHFRELLIDGNSLIVGARNYVYNISLDTFQEQSRITWFSSGTDVQMCLLRQKTAEECQNFVRVVVRRTDSRLLVCGTNAFKPVCHTYEYDARTGYTVMEVESAIARCPYDPSHNSTAVYVGDQLYSGTVADLSSRDWLIYRKPMRTEQHDSQWLNDPNFVSSFEYKERVYFFFRETAVENINCGKAIFSRVARVCANDQGGARVLRHTWTSFFKARLNCSLPGEFPFYFDEIQSTSLLGDGNVFSSVTSKDRVPMIYAVFTTPRNSLHGAAVCAFKMSDIIASFEGPFKEQKSVHSNWLPVRDAEVPDPHPAMGCASDSTLLSDQSLNFIKSHPLMDKAVPAFSGQPVLVQTSLEYSLTQIAVDWQVHAADSHYYDVLFIGTDNGRILKAINKGRDLTNIDPIVIEVISVFGEGLAITGLRIHHQANDPHNRRLIVMSRDEIRSIPVHRCGQQSTCSECVAVKDPYCSWADGACLHLASGLQNIEMGYHPRCAHHVRTKLPRTTTTTVTTTTTTRPKTTTSLAPTCAPCVCEEKWQPGSNDPPVMQPTAGSLSTKTVYDNDMEVDGDKVLPSKSAIGPCYGSNLDGNTAMRNSESGLYSPGIVAVIAIVCSFFSLIIGFFIGFGINLYRFHHGHQHPHTGPDIRPCYKDFVIPEHASHQNVYDEPQKTSFPTFNVDASQPKQINNAVPTQPPRNIFVNDLKPNNSKLANGAAESSLRAPLSRQAIYL